MPPRPTLRDRTLLGIQRTLSYLFFPVVAATALIWVHWIRRLSLANAEGVRAEFDRIVREERTPILLCSNHLTLVDTVILAWALVPVRGYLMHYSRFPWSIPERANFSNTAFWRVASFLGKSVYVTRGGPREEVRRTLGKIIHLLRSGEIVSIFPEGGRSRSGRVDTEDFAYGVGQIVLGVPEARVLCAYMRGESQEGYSDFPARGEVYRVDLKVLRPVTSHSGLRGARDLATQIVHTLAEMEVQHLADRERSRRPHNAGGGGQGEG